MPYATLELSPRSSADACLLDVWARGRVDAVPGPGSRPAADDDRVVNRCLAVGLVGVALLGATTAWAQSIDAGTLELTIAAGGGASLQTSDVSPETVTSFWLLPHLGYFLTSEVGNGALRGNFEIPVEPTLIHLDASNSATVGGVAGLLCLRLRPGSE